MARERARKAVRAGRVVQAAVEALEPRRLLAAVTVTTLADDLAPGNGTVSLREAITAINAGGSAGDADAAAQNPGVFGNNDTINFNIPGAGVRTINVGSGAGAAGIPLPTIVRPVTINGYSQAGASANTLANADNALILIELNGAGAGAGVNGLTLGPGSGGSTIMGLAINRFPGDGSLSGGVGILVESDGNTVAGNFVGVNAAGASEAPNGGDGIRILEASNNRIGGTRPADRNITSGNVLDGIHVEGTLTAPATGNLIQGNFVGVGADGVSRVGVRTAPVPNAGALGSDAGNFLFGIEISGGNYNTVGGTTPGARNVVGFDGAGIEVDNGGQGNIIQGNYSGVGADGVTPIKNLLHGIVLRSSNTFGAPLGPAQPNEPGVSFNLIGGTAAGAGNLVEFNGTGGIAVFGNPVSASGQPNIGNAIEGNSFFQNGRNSPATLLGIDLTNQFKFPPDDGITPNDSQGHSAPNAPNNFQNFPVLTRAMPAGDKTQTSISGTLNAAPNSTFRVEFFASDADPAGGVAEGQQYLGFADVTTNAGGSASFTAVVNGTVATGRLLTATATDGIGNTSEFSAPLLLATTVPNAPFAIAAAAASGSKIDVTWIDNSNNEAGFVVERALGNGPFVPVVTLAANTTSYADTGLAAGATYTYRVRAFNSVGDSSYVNTSTATTQGAPGTPTPTPAPTPTTAPNAPFAVAAVAISSDEVDISWRDNSSNETGFAVERQTGNGPFVVIAANLPANTTFFADTSAAPSTTYTYRVRAFNALADSSFVNTSTATTPAAASPTPTPTSAPATVPNAPFGLTAKAVSSNEVDLTWIDNSNNETGFAVERRTGNGVFVVIAGNLPANTTSFADTTAAGQTAYTYRVRAFNAIGDSSFVDLIGVTTP